MLFGVGDVDCAFLKINGYGPMDRDRFVAFKASKGSRLRLYKLTISLQADCMAKRMRLCCGGRR